MRPSGIPCSRRREPRETCPRAGRPKLSRFRKGREAHDEEVEHEAVNEPSNVSLATFPWCLQHVTTKAKTAKKSTLTRPHASTPWRTFAEKKNKNSMRPDLDSCAKTVGQSTRQAYFHDRSCPTAATTAWRRHGRLEATASKSCHVHSCDVLACGRTCGRAGTLRAKPKFSGHLTPGGTPPFRALSRARTGLKTTGNSG